MTEVATLGLRVDGVAGVDKAASSLDKLSDSASTAEKSSGAVSRGFDQVNSILSDIARSVSPLAGSLQSLNKTLSDQSAMLSRVESSLSSVSKETASTTTAVNREAEATVRATRETESFTRAAKDGGASVQQFGRRADEASKDVEDMAQESAKAERSVKGVGDESDRASRGVNGLASAARRAAGILATFLGTREIVNYSNAWSDMTSLVRVNIGEQEDAAAVMSRLSDIARGTYSSLELTAQGFAMNAFTLNALGASTQQQLGYTEALNNALVVSGARGQQAELVQNSLNRALAEGSLKSQELQNVMNYGSRIAELLADELGVNVTQLRALANDGKITGDVIFRSLVGNMERLSEQAESMPATLADAFQLLRNSFLQMVGIFDQANGISESLAERIINISDAIRDIDPGPQYNLITALSLASGAVGALTVAYTLLAASVWAANTAMTAFTKLLRINPLVLAASAAIALGGALYTARDRVVEIGDATGTIGEYLLATWQEVTSRIQDYWADTVDSVIGWLDEIGVDAASVAGGIKTVFTTSLDALILGFRLTFNAAVGTFMAMQTVATGVAQSISTAFTTMGGNAKTIFEALWKDIQALLSLDFSTSHFTNAIENELVSVADAVGRTVAATAGRVAEQLTDDHLGNIVSTASSYFDDLGTSIEKRVGTNQQVEKFTELSRRLLGMGREATVTGENMTVLANAVDNTKDTVDKLTKGQRDAQKEAERFQSSLQSLIDTLFPVEAAQRVYREEQEVLTRAWNEGTITADRYTEAMRRLERAQLSAQTAAGAYGGGGGFGTEIGSRGEVGSPTDPLARNEDDDYWTKWLESAETALTDFDTLAANSSENFQRGFGNAFEAMVFDSQNLGDAMFNLFDGIARSLVNALGQMAAQWLAYQAVQLLVGKTTQAQATSAIVTNALAKQQEAGLNAYAATAAIPIVGPVAAPAAMAAAIAATTPAVTAITALSAAGMAHDGIDRIPREGTWLLDQGERVVSRPQADRLDAYLSRQEQPQQAQAVAPVVNVIENPNRAGASEQRQDQDGKWVIDIFVANIQQGGKADKAIRANYGLSRQGV